MEFFQGEKHSDPRKANKILGKALWRVFMDRIVESHGKLDEIRVPLIQVRPRREYLPVKVTGKYFKRPRPATCLHELDTGKQRIRKLLGRRK